MMMQTLLASLFLIGAAMFVLWLISLVRRDASIADPFWGLGFAMTAWLAWLLNTPLQPRGLLLVGLVTVWGGRLCLFLLWRHIGRGEDHRYAAMRERHGQRFWWVSLLTVFWLQGLILWFIAFPIQVTAVVNAPTAFGIVDGCGLLLWSTGLFFESVGDWQLRRFRSQPANAGRVLDTGLWRFTRHPNYFGDCCVWWGLYLIATAGGAGWTIGSPLLMTYLLLRVSGVTLLEADISNRRPEYAAYQARTNAFFPGPPKAE